MALTLKDLFGSNASYDPNTRKLLIQIDDFQNNNPDFGIGDFTNGLGMDLSSINASNADQYAERFFWALIQLRKQKQPEINNDDTIGIYITNQGRRNLNRNGTAQIGYQELVTGYKYDPSGTTLDPDEIGEASST